MDLLCKHDDQVSWTHSLSTLSCRGLLFLGTNTESLSSQQLTWDLVLSGWQLILSMCSAHTESVLGQPLNHDTSTIKTLLQLLKPGEIKSSHACLNVDFSSYFSFIITFLLCFIVSLLIHRGQVNTNTPCSHKVNTDSGFIETIRPTGNLLFPGATVEHAQIFKAQTLRSGFWFSLFGE